MPWSVSPKTTPGRDRRRFSRVPRALQVRVRSSEAVRMTLADATPVVHTARSADHSLGGRPNLGAQDSTPAPLPHGVYHRFRSSSQGREHIR